MISERSANILRSVISAPAPTKQYLPTTAWLRIVAPMPISEKSPTVQPCTVAPWPIVTLVADRARRVGVDVDHGGVLHVRVVADADVIDVAAQHGAEPDVGMAAQEDSADDGRARRDVELVADGLHAMCAEVVEHGYFFALA